MDKTKELPKKSCKDCEFNDPKLCGYVRISIGEGKTHYAEIIHNCPDFVRINYV